MGDRDSGKFTFGSGGDFQLVDTSASNNIASVFGMFDFGKENCGDSPDHSRSRKRKVDKDGFVHPTTPDIPKTSSQYDRGKGDVTGNFSDLFDLGETSNTSVETETPEQLYENGSSEQQESSVENPTQEQQSQYFGASVTETDQNTAQPDPAGDRTISQPAGSVDALMKGFGEDMKNLYENWGETFQMSEEFEHLCPQRLDMYIQRALEIERKLNRQKDVLCNRLRGLGSTLQM